jgi:hypothetical protein
MLPIDLETEEVDIELQGLGFIENPQDRGGFTEAHGHVLAYGIRPPEAGVSGSNGLLSALS